MEEQIVVNSRSATLPQVTVYGRVHALGLAALGVSAGLYFLTVFWGLELGQIRLIAQAVAIGLAAVGGLVILFAELTYPLVFIRRFLTNFKDCWMSRGPAAILIFMAVGVVGCIIDGLISSDSGALLGVMVVAGLLALIVMVYQGLVMSSASIRFWKTPLVPLEFIASDLAGGLALIFILDTLMGGLLGNDTLNSIKISMALVIICTAFLIIVHVFTVPRSIKARTIYLLIRGQVRNIFITGFMISGLLIPLLLIAFSYLASGLVEQSLLFVSGILVFLGIVMHRLTLFRAAVRPSMF